MCNLIPLRVLQNRFNSQTGNVLSEAYIALKTGGCQDVRGSGKGADDVVGFDDAQVHVPVNPPKREIIDQITIGRDVFIFSRIDVYRQYILARRDVFGDLERERRKTAPVYAKQLAVDVDGSHEHHAVKVDENALARNVLRKRETLAIGRNELIVGVIHRMSWKQLVGVGKRHFFKAIIWRIKLDLLRNELPTVVEVPNNPHLH